MKQIGFIGQIGCSAILPSSSGGGGGALEWLFTANFADDHYEYQGSAAEYDDIFATDTDNWGQAPTIVPGTGITEHGPVITPTPTGLLFASGGTLVMEFGVTTVGAVANAVFIQFFNAPIWDHFIEVSANTQLNSSHVVDEISNPGSPTLARITVVGLHKLAIAFEEGRIAASLDGGTACILDYGFFSALNEIGLAPNGNGYIKSINGLVGATANADLPALSALPPPEWVPEGALQVLDFKNGHYWDGEKIVALADLTVEDVDNWGTFNPEAIVPGVGLINGAMLMLAGAALASAVAGATFVLETEMSSGHYGDTGLTFIDIPDWNTENFVTFSSNGETTFGAAFAGLTLSSTPLDGTQKIAATFTPSRMAASLDGGATIPNETASDPPWNAVGIAANGSAPDGGILRSIIIYPPQLDAALSAL
jgi:hypothetical protein